MPKENATRALANMMGRISDQLQIAGENDMSDLPVRLVRRRPLPSVIGSLQSPTKTMRNC